MANLSLAHSLIFRKLKQQKHHGLNFQFLDYFHLQGKFKLRPKGKEVIIKLLAIIQTSKKKPTN